MLAAGAVGGGCHKGGAEKPAVRAAAGRNSGAPISEQATLDFARRVEALAATGDSDELGELFDWERLVDRTFAGIKIEPQDRQLTLGIWKNANVFAAPVCATTEAGGSYRFLRLKTDGGRKLPVFRLRQPTPGVNYHELALGEDSAGELRISDVYIYASGQWLSETLRFALLRESAGSRPKWWSSLTEAEKAVVTHGQAIKQIQKLGESQQFNAALNLYATLPPAVQDALPVLLLRMHAAAEADAPASRSALESLERHFARNPAVDLVSIDHFFTIGQYGAERQAIARLNRRVGGDPYLQILYANTFAAEKKLAEAAERAQRAIDEEPTMEDAYWVRLDVAVMMQDHAQAAEMLRRIETTFNTTIGDMTSVPLYDDFVKSDEYVRWKADHPDPPAASADDEDEIPAAGEDR